MTCNNSNNLEFQEASVNCNQCIYESQNEGTLIDRIRCFNQNYSKLIQEENDVCKSVKTPKEAIYKAALCTDSHDRLFGHQYRIGYKRTKNAAIDLSNNHEQKIVFIAMKKNFDELYNYIKSYANNISGLGELYCYDVSIRLAYYFKIDIENVFLHAGTNKGANHLHLTGENGKIPHSQLPNDLKNNLTADGVESFLCTCKKTLFPSLLEQ